MKDQEITINNYTLLLWEDEDENNVKQISISPIFVQPEDHFVCFAHVINDKDDPDTVIIADHGLISGQYLSRGQKKFLTEVIGIQFGQRHEVESLWQYIKEIGGNINKAN